MKIPLKADPTLGLLKRIRALMATEEDVQTRLDSFVKVISQSMKVNVCSIYLRSGDALELCATKGLKQEAVHTTKIPLSEGLVGNVARNARLLNLAKAPEHSDFSFRPETGEQKFNSFLGVPLLRGGRNLGVLVVQSKKAREFSELEVENLLTAATILAEIAIEDERSGGPQKRLKGIALTPTGPETIIGKTFAEGLKQGHAILHRPPLLAGDMIAKDISSEQKRLEKAIKQLRHSVDKMMDGAPNFDDNTQEIFETYRMFANDRSWLTNLRDAVSSGLTAEAAVERVRSEHRARLLKIRDPYLRARLHDLEDLANRLQRLLGGENLSFGQRQLAGNAIVFARNLGPAEILDYGDMLSGVVLEEGAATAHATIICRSLGIPLIGEAGRVLDMVEENDPVLLDAELGEIRIRPTQEDIDEFMTRVQIRNELEGAFEKQRDLSCITKDGKNISLLINAGLLVDLPGLDNSGAQGIGLFRTEFQFMVARSMPRLDEQVELYSKVLTEAGNRPVTFRTLDLGGDKILPYADPLPEQNPAIGWRAIRIGLDRPALLRYQLRALIQAGAERNLRIMFPMVSVISEYITAKELLNKEINRAKKIGQKLPDKLEIGIMLETPSLAWQIDAICKQADFVSVGANDLMQFFFAADRDNPRIADRYDRLHPGALSLLAHIANSCQKAGVEATICGEMGGYPIEAICLVALGYKNLSMPVSGIGPVKSAILTLDAGRLKALLKKEMHTNSDADSLRPLVKEFCAKEGVVV